MKAHQIVRLVTAIALFAAPLTHLATAETPLRAHSQNPHIFEFRGQPTVLHTYGEQYGSIFNTGFDFTPYLDVIQRDGMNLTRVFLVGHRGIPGNGTNTSPLAAAPAQFLQPWPRSNSPAKALDGLGKWDFSAWNENYFTRLNAFAQACSDRGIVIELTLFSTLYEDAVWRATPFNPANNIQGYGPNRFPDAMRPVSSELLAIQEAVVRRIVREMNRFDNIYYEVQNEPFWNEPGSKEYLDVAFQNRILGVILDEESNLPHQHLIAHNYPQQASALATGFKVINDHYPAFVPNTNIAGAEVLLRDHYSRNLILGLGETNTSNAIQTRLEGWMFLLGGGGIYNGLDAIPKVYSVEYPSGDSALGREIRKAVRNAANYVRSLNMVSIRRDLSWISGGIPIGATLQAMAHRGQQYVAYLHHGKSGIRSYQTFYDPIDSSTHTASLVVGLEQGSWRAVWTRPADMVVLHTEEFTHQGGAYSLAAVSYQEDVALRIDRTGSGDTSPPPSPTDLIAFAKNDGSIEVSWSRANAADLEFYHVYRSLKPGTLVNEINRIAILSQSTANYNDTSTEPGNTYYYTLTALDLLGNSSSASREVSAKSFLGSRPFGGNAKSVPGVIQAEDFDIGGQTISYYDQTPSNEDGQYRASESVDINTTNDEGGGHHLSRTETGEWVNYTVKVASTGGYSLGLRIANPTSGGKIAFEVDGEKVGETIDLPETGNLQTWETVTVPGVQLAGGEHILRLVMVNQNPGGIAGAINWISFTALPRIGPTARAGQDLVAVDQDRTGFEMVTLNANTSLPGNSPIVSFSWSESGALLASTVNPTINLGTGTHLIELTVVDGSGQENTDEILVTVSAKEFVNGSFESGYLGWVTSGNQGIYSPPTYTTTHGTKLIVFNAGNSPPNAVISQTFASAVGQNVTIEFDVGVLAYNQDSQTMQVTVTGVGNLVSKTTILKGQGGGAIRWIPQTLAFVANSISTTVTFRDQSSTTNAIDLLLDNVRVSGGSIGPNTAPVAVADSFSIDQNTALIIPAGGVLSNDTDAESNPLTAVLNVGPSHGSVTSITSGGFTYSPTINFVGVDSFTYYANDGNLNSNVVTVVINVTPILSVALTNGSFEQEFLGWTKTGNLEIRSGSPYTATDGIKLVAFNTSQTTPNATLSQAFSTVTGQTYTLQFDAGVLAYNTYWQTLGVTATGTGVGSLLSKTITITGVGGGTNRWLPQSFTFVANSSSTILAFRDQSSSTDALDLLLDNIRLTRTIVGPNTAPIAIPDSYSAGQNTTLVISAAGVLSNDTDAQSSQLTAIYDSGPQHGTVSLSANGGFIYTPTTDYSGGDSFSYHSNDGSLNSNIATVTINIVALIPGVTFPTIAGNTFIARFRVVPKSPEITIPALRFKITGNAQLKDVELNTALPIGENSVPYFILFTADSDITTLRFTALNGESASSGQIAELTVAEPLTIDPSNQPNLRQQAQIDRRYGLFLHYGINTFNNLEWSDGTKPASSYQPSALDVEQWVKTASEAGMRYVLIISKHHDGFCLWDSPWTNYDVGSSPVTTNVIAAAAAACRKYGIALGLYYSVWDRHEPSYGNDAAYNQFMLRQLQELLGKNGPICELWLDGAWDKANSRWPSTELYDLVRRLQPDCQVSFNGTIGNPSGPDTNAIPANQQEGFPIRYFPADFRLSDPLYAKTPDPKIFSHHGSSYYLPFEATTMLSGYGNWFFHPSDTYVRSVNDLAAVYDSATAQNNILVLNAPPDSRGQVRELERSTLFQLRDRLGLKSGLNLPYESMTHNIPGKIQLEDFDTGGQGVAYNDVTPTNSGAQYRAMEAVDIASTTDEGGGYHILGTSAGEWLKYTVTVSSADDYLFNIRTANPTAGGGITIEVDGNDVTGLISIPNTGSINTWQTVTVPHLFLNAGEHILRLVVAHSDPGGIAGAFNWISFTAQPRPGPTADAGPDLEVLDPDSNGFGDVILDASASVTGNSSIANFEWKQGGLHLASGNHPALSLAIGNHEIQLIVTDTNGLSDTDEVVVSVSARGLVNGSFENGYHGWVTSGNQSVESLAPYVASDGVKLVAFNSRDLQANGNLSQVFNTKPGQAYLLKFDAGVLAYNTNAQTMQVTLEGSSNVLSKTISISGVSGVIVRWMPQSFRFVADSTSTTLTFRDLSTSFSGIDLLLDNIWVSKDTSHQNNAPVAVADSYSIHQNGSLVVPPAGVIANDEDAESNTLVASLNASPSHGSVVLNRNGGFTYVPAVNFIGTDSFTYHVNDAIQDSNIVSVDIAVNIIPSGLKIMPLGDSITYGSTGTDGGYRGPLYKRLNPLNLDFRFVGTSIEGAGSLPATPVDQRYHEGHSSYTVQDIFNNLDGFDNTIFLQHGGADRNPNGGYWFTGENGTGRVAMFPDVIFLMIGTNDVTNLADVGVRLQSLITKVTIQRPSAKLFVAKIIPWPARQAAVASYNTIVTSAVEIARAAGSNIYLVDLNTGYPSGGLHSDGVHPNDIGYNWIADRWHQSLVDSYSLHTASIINGSFEADETGWTMSGNRSVVASNDALVAFHGLKMLVFNGGDTTPDAVVTQTFVTIPGKTYQLSFKMGVRGLNFNEQRLSIRIAGSSPLIPQAVESMFGNGQNSTVWEAKTYEFIADHTETTVTFADASVATSEIDLLLDNVNVTDSLNTKPIAAADSYSVSQNTSLVVPDAGVIANDSDADMDPLTAEIDTVPSHGDLILNVRGGFTYTPTTGYTGADSFTYHVSDGSSKSNVVTVTITVGLFIPVNLVNGSFESSFLGWVTSGNVGIYSSPFYTPTNGSKLVGFNAGQSTPNAVLSQTFATAVGQAYRLEFDVGVLAYNFNPQKLQVVVTGTGELQSKTITIDGVGGGRNRWLPQSLIFTTNSTSTTLAFRDVSSSSDALDLLLDHVRITQGAAPTNTNPVAVTDSYSTDQNTALVVPDAGVLMNDTDGEFASLTSVIVTIPVHGIIRLNVGGGFTFTPAAGYSGTDSFTYQANDGSLNSNIVSVNLAILPVVSGFFVNGSFETGLSGWTKSGNVEIRSGAPYAATNGTQLVAFNSGNRTPDAILSQSFATIPGQTYILKFDAGVLSYNTYPQGIQVTVTGAGSLLSQTITINGLGGGSNRWLPQSFTFVANSASVNLSFRDVSTSTIGLDLLLDNVRVTETSSNAPPSLVLQSSDEQETAEDLPEELALQPAGLGTPSLSGSPGDLTIRMTAPATGNYFLERSEDLKVWEYVTESWFNESDSIEFHDTQGSSDLAPVKTKMFYRIGFSPKLIEN